jgi:catechol 2,3-dioxygenase-like lactoylglutathione lyase family enzyme
MNKENNSKLISLKTVIRTRDFSTSKHFYSEILQLRMDEEYDDGNGSKGIIFRIGSENSNALIEVSEISQDHDYYQPGFDNSFLDNKASIQIRTDNIDYWAKRLHEKWQARGPILRPWGSQYLYVEDPDGLQIIIYQEKVS